MSWADKGLIFANPASETARVNQTIYVSLHGGKQGTWTHRKHIAERSGYSTLQMTANGKMVANLFERGGCELTIALVDPVEIIGREGEGEEGHGSGVAPSVTAMPPGTSGKEEEGKEAHGHVVGSPVTVAPLDMTGREALEQHDGPPIAVTQLELDAWSAALINGTVDALIDVRTPEEFGSQWGRIGVCKSSTDTRACSYGHVAGAYWMPDLHLMSEADLIANMTGTRDDPRGGLLACSGLRLAFICHSGVRSNLAALKLKDAYLHHAITSFDNATIHGGGILNAGGGTQAYFDGGLLTHYGFARAPWPGCATMRAFAAMWPSKPPSQQASNDRHAS